MDPVAVAVGVALPIVGLICVLSAVAPLMVAGALRLALDGAERQQLAQRESLRAVGVALGLQGVSAFGVHGAIDGLGISIDLVDDSEGTNRVTRIRVSGGPRGLRIQAEDLGTAIGRSIGEDDVRTGDDKFDDLIWISGEPRDVVRSRMDEPARIAVRRAVHRGAKLAGGTWMLELDRLVLDQPTLLPLVRLVVDAARAVAHAGDPDERLAAIVAQDREAGVRLLALRSLIARGSGADLAPYLADPDPRVAIVAARALGDVDALIAHLADPVVQVRRSAALGLAELANEAGHRAAEPVLLPFVRGGDLEVVAALGRVGTVAAVEALSRLAGSGLGVGGPARQAREAVRAIQSRVVGGERGSLALAVAEGGELSIPERET